MTLRPRILLEVTIKVFHDLTILIVKRICLSIVFILIVTM
jgi:hypothetical protein